MEKPSKFSMNDEYITDKNDTAINFSVNIGQILNEIFIHIVFL